MNKRKYQGIKSYMYGIRLNKEDAEQLEQYVIDFGTTYTQVFTNALRLYLEKDY